MLNLTDCLEPNVERAAGDVIDGEAIIINLVTGAYYSMQGIGGEIWSMISARRSVGSMLDEIVAAYDVDYDAANRDLHAVLQQLLDEGLIQPAGDSGAVSATPEFPVRKAYKKPALQVFRDMEELLALDPPAPGMNQIAWSDRGSGSGSK
jgi:hypothetical protein